MKQNLPPTGLPRIIMVIVRNMSFEVTQPVTHTYIFTAKDSSFSISANPGTAAWIMLEPFKAHISDELEGLGNQYALPNRINALPPGASEVFSFGVECEPPGKAAAETLRLQLHTTREIHKYPFIVSE